MTKAGARVIADMFDAGDFFAESAALHVYEAMILARDADDGESLAAAAKLGSPSD